MSNSKKNRSVTFLLSEPEFEVMEANFKTTYGICRSEYLRRMVLQKPVPGKIRNVSIDDFITDMIPLKKELRAAVATFDEPRFSRAVEVILSRIEKLYRIWLP